MPSAKNSSNIILIFGTFIVAILIFSSLKNNGIELFPDKASFDKFASSTDFTDIKIDQQLESNTVDSENFFDHVLKSPKKSFNVHISTSTYDMRVGLGQKKSISDDEGMLFIFDKPGRYSFWMKDMFFPIDIIWIDDSKRVQSIDSRIATSTYPSAFSPDTDISYVLELNAGLAERFGINKGTLLEF